MATLKAMFKLFDGYSRTADVIEKKTKKATDKILEASGATDNFNRKLELTGTSASKASGGIGKLVGSIISLAAAKKGMDISDGYINTAARLKLINDGLHTQAELQDKIFASADRARGSYADMADAVAKMGLMAGDSFGSNDELIGFTELVQKSFKLGGTDKSTQQGAIRQLTQAMASGRLQGDELTTISEGAPLIYDAIAKYMGKSKGELKELGSQGLITSDIIKNAIFDAADGPDGINARFERMPMTFGDIWNKIANGATRKFKPLIERVNKFINSDKFNKFTDSLVNGFGAVANIAGKAFDVIGKVYNFISDNWDKLRPIIEGVTSAWLAYKSALLLVKVAQWAVNIAMAANPIGIAIVLLAVLVGAVVYLWETSEKFRKFWADMWSGNMKSTAKAYNAVVPVFNKFIDGYNWLIDKEIELSETTRKIWLCIVKAVANGIKGLIENFSFLTDRINKFIPTYNKIADIVGWKKIDVEFTTEDLTSGIDKIINHYEGVLMGEQDKYAEKMRNRKKKHLETVDLDKFNKTVDEIAKQIEDFTISGWLKGLFEETNIIKDLMPTDPIPVEGNGPGGAVKVEMSDEDLRYLRDIAERDYINKFSTATLAPNITVSFGDVHEEADVEKLYGRVKTILQEEIAMAAEGSYQS